MLDMQEIENAIEELENGRTTLESCKKLATLYIVRQNYKNANLNEINALEHDSNDKVIAELEDLLPSYSEYCQIRRRFQLHELPQEAVLDKLSLLCSEIHEFISALYRSTSSEAEREVLLNSITSFSFL